MRSNFTFSSERLFQKSLESAREEEPMAGPLVSPAATGTSRCASSPACLLWTVAVRRMRSISQRQALGPSMLALQPVPLWQMSNTRSSWTASAASRRRSEGRAGCSRAGQYNTVQHCRAGRMKQPGWASTAMCLQVQARLGLVRVRWQQQQH